MILCVSVLPFEPLCGLPFGFLATSTAWPAATCSRHGRCRRGGAGVTVSRYLRISASNEYPSVPRRCCSMRGGCPSSQSTMTESTKLRQARGRARRSFRYKRTRSGSSGVSGRKRDASSHEFAEMLMVADGGFSPQHIRTIVAIIDSILDNSEGEPVWTHS